MICIHCEHQFVGGAFIRGSGPGTSVAMRRCPKCEREFVAPPKLRAPGKIAALQSEIDALRAQLDEARAELTRWATWGTIEVAIRNPNVASYIEHWEKRALSAEAERDALRVRVKELEVELAKLQDKINPPRAHYERP